MKPRALDKTLDIPAEVKEIVRKEFGVPLTDIKPETRFIEDLRGDLLSELTIYSECEKKFEIQIPEEDRDKLKTYGALEKYVVDLVAKKEEDEFGPDGI